MTSLTLQLKYVWKKVIAFIENDFIVKMTSNNLFHSLSVIFWSKIRSKKVFFAYIIKPHTMNYTIEWEEVTLHSGGNTS